MVQDLSPLLPDLERSVLTQTGRRVRGLSIEVEQEHIVLRGRVQTYHLKQLAQHGVQVLLPHVPLENAITVGDSSIN